MAYNESLAVRVIQMLEARKVRFAEKRMFGGLCFMVDDKMLMGVEKARLMVRIDPEVEAKALKRKGASPMDFTGLVLEGFILIDESGIGLDKGLEYPVALCPTFNPKAKPVKRKKGNPFLSHTIEFASTQSYK